MELVTVGALIGILAAFAGPSFLGWRSMVRVKGSAREITSLLRLARSRSLEAGTREVVVFYKGDPTISSDDRVAVFSDWPVGFNVTGLSTDQLDGKVAPPTGVTFITAANASDITRKTTEIGFGPGVARTFPYPYNTVSISSSCSFCSASWGAVFFEGDGKTIRLSNGSSALAASTFFGAVTVSPIGEWATGPKNYYTVILNTVTGAASVWNSSDK